LREGEAEGSAAEGSASTVNGCQREGPRSAAAAAATNCAGGSGVSADLRLVLPTLAATPAAGGRWLPVGGASARATHKLAVVEAFQVVIRKGLALGRVVRTLVLDALWKQMECGEGGGGALMRARAPGEEGAAAQAAGAGACVRASSRLAPGPEQLQGGARLMPAPVCCRDVRENSTGGAACAAARGLPPPAACMFVPRLPAAP
jgi:hypothetical protein